MGADYLAEKRLTKNPLHECNTEGIFDPRFDYFARRKEGQNCESGDFVFRMIVLQSSIINGLQRVQKCSHKNISSFLMKSIGSADFGKEESRQSQHFVRKFTLRIFPDSTELDVCGANFHQITNAQIQTSQNKSALFKFYRPKLFNEFIIG